MAHKAVGIHVFAGGFTMGVKSVFDVQCQLEVHNFGRETCEQVVDVPFINDTSADWPDVEAQFCYGNPRCTAFSCMTAGYSEAGHGPWAKQTVDIHNLCEYAAGRYDVIIWESVQQAYSVGRPLLDYLRDDIFVPKGYRIAHILMNAASFGNAQQRKRYFFVAYRDDRNFNICPPEINEHRNVLYDIIYDIRNHKTQPSDPRSSDYGFDSYQQLSKEDAVCVPYLPNGWDMNALARYHYDILPKRYQRMWDLRGSQMPFSMHCIKRLNWLMACPTLHGSCGRFIHPEHHRPLTYGELATIMGWGGEYPRGPWPQKQIAKGVSPPAGRWLAEQAELYLNDEWGNEDWESSYDHAKGEWVGKDCRGAVEKTFNLTRYVSKTISWEKYDGDNLPQKHRFNVDPISGRPIRPWKKVAEQTRAHAGALGLPCGLVTAEGSYASEKLSTGHKPSVRRG